METGTLELEEFDGSGYGSGDGSGSGYGSGYGSGSGDGSGSGSGYGYGYGSGSGYGDGYGDGSGDGYGYGYGDGSGSGDGRETLIFLNVLFPEFKKNGGVVTFWRSAEDGTPANGGSGTRASVGLVEEIKGPLQICTKRGLHGTCNLSKWKGNRIWIVGLHGPIQRDDDKFASLKRTFLADLGTK